MTGRHRRTLALLVGSALLSWLSGRPATAELPEQIPLEVLFGNPTRTQARISPDGTRLSFLAPSAKGVLNVWVRTLGGDDETMVTNDEERGIRIHFWSKSGKRLFYLQDIAGDENWHLYSVDLESRVVRDLTPFQGIRVGEVLTDHNHPDEVLVSLNLRDRSLFDMYRVDLRSGAIAFDTENPGDVLGWLTDPQFRIRGAFASNNEDGSQTLRVRESPEHPWAEVMHWPFEENGNALDFAADGQSIYVESSLDSDTTRLLRIDAKSGKVLEELAHDDRCDVGRVEIHPISHRVQAVEFDYLKSEWKVLDPDVQKDFEVLDGAFRGNFGISARDHGDKTWIVYHEVDDGPLSYHTYDRESRQLTKLFVDRPELENYRLAERKPLVIETRDGMKMVSYLTLPVGLEPKALPMVLNPHGGPWARDAWGYDSWAQWFANRGYAVLQPNFRGSAGFGKAFLNAGNEEWGVGAMQHDLTDAARWAVAQGIADPQRVAIAGGSYGGYATLAGLTFTPDLYACGVDIVGPSHIKTLFQSIPPYWAPFKKQLVLRVGDAEGDEELNRKISPLFHADKIRAPLIIGQGANDPRVNIAESDQIVEAMRANGRPVSYVVYTDEGHGFARPENRMDFYGRADRFLADCLGGRHEAFEMPAGSSAELR